MLRCEGAYDPDAVSRETAWSPFSVDAVTGEVIVLPSLTKQSFAAECDINVMLERFAVTGVVPTNPIPPQYGDFTDVTTYQDALNRVIAADAAFMQLSAELRARFNNDAGTMLAFLADDANRPEAVRLGLVQAPPAVEAHPPKGASGASSPPST